MRGIVTEFTTQSPVIAQTLSGIEIFNDLDLEERTTIAGYCRGLHFEAGDQIIAYKEKSADAYFIVSGEVRATIFAFTGKKVSFRDIGAEKAFGEWSAIDGLPRSSSVIALSDAFVLSMSATAFKEVVTRHPAIAWTMLEEITLLARRLSDRVVEFSTLQVKSRLHIELLRLAREGDRGDGTAEIVQFPTNEEMASRIGARREAVNRELRNLEKTGLIKRESERYVITDMVHLEKLVKEAIGD